MFSYLYRKLTGKKTSKEIKEEAFFEKFSQQSQKFIKVLDNLIEKARKEFFSIRKKCENLLDTNYKLGILHLEKGNLSDAKIRFSIIIKFWPNFYEAYYQKAYIHMLEKKPLKAKEVIDQMMQRKPDKIDPKISSLIDQIESSLQSSGNNE